MVGVRVWCWRGRRTGFNFGAGGGGGGSNSQLVNPQQQQEAQNYQALVNETTFSTFSSFDEPRHCSTPLPGSIFDNVNLTLTSSSSNTTMIPMTTMGTTMVTTEESEPESRQTRTRTGSIPAPVKFFGV